MKIERIIRNAIEQEFGDVEILSIKVRPDLDEDGEKVLFVEVVFDGNRKQLDARKTSGLARQVLPQIGDEGFPIFSFIASSELGKTRAETA